MNQFLFASSIVIFAAANTFAADLFRDDFSRFPPGWLTTPVGTLNPATQEYHYLPHRGVPLGPWANAIAHMDAWVIGDEDGHPYLEEHLDSTSKQWSYPIFLTGEPEWADYNVEVKVKPLNRVDSAGVAFRYRTNRNYYYFALTGGNKATLRLHPCSRCLDSSPPLVSRASSATALRVSSSFDAEKNSSVLLLRPSLPRAL